MDFCCRFHNTRLRDDSEGEFLQDVELPLLQQSSRSQYSSLGTLPPLPPDPPSLQPSAPSQPAHVDIPQPVEPDLISITGNPEGEDAEIGGEGAYSEYHQPVEVLSVYDPLAGDDVSGGYDAGPAYNTGAGFGQVVQYSQPLASLPPFQQQRRGGYPQAFLGGQQDHAGYMQSLPGVYGYGALALQMSSARASGSYRILPQTVGGTRYGPQHRRIEELTGRRREKQRSARKSSELQTCKSSPLSRGSR